MSYTSLNEIMDSSNKRLKKRIVLLSVLCVVLLTIICLAIVFFVQTRIIPQDINSVNGCPEFYNLEWGMSVKEAERKVKLKHSWYEAVEDKSPVLKETSLYETEDYMKDSDILIDEDETFYLYGRKTDEVLIGFEKDSLDNVIIIFSKDDSTLEKMVELYEEIYGKATETGSFYSTWKGNKTTIDVFDSKLLSEEDENTVVVRYVSNDATEFPNLSFDGSEIDPCNFLGENYIFDKSPDYYIAGLTEGEDYSYEHNSAEGFASFSRYTLYPEFEYMGIAAGDTAIELYVEEGEKTIEMFSYLFLLDKTNAVDRIDYIKAGLDKVYGQHIDCGYASMKYDELGVVDLSFEELKSRVASGQQGIYHIQWQNGDNNVTLDITIKPNETVYEGAAAFSG